MQSKLHKYTRHRIIGCHVRCPVQRGIQKEALTANLCNSSHAPSWMKSQSRSSTQQLAKLIMWLYHTDFRGHLYVFEKTTDISRDPRGKVKFFTLDFRCWKKGLRHLIGRGFSEKMKWRCIMNPTSRSSSRSTEPPPAGCFELVQIRFIGASHTNGSYSSTCNENTSIFEMRKESMVHADESDL